MSYREGTVEQVDLGRQRVRVRFADVGALSPWLSVLHRNTLNNQDQGIPEEGEFVACLLDAREEHGCVLGSLYTANNKPAEPSTEVRRTTFGDGGDISYDRENSTLSLSGMTVQSDGDFNTSANVNVDGKTTSGEMVAGAGAAKLTRDDLLQSVLNTLKSAISSAPTAAQDGGATFKGALVAALGSWPASTECSKVSSD